MTKRVNLSSYAGGYTRQLADTMVAGFEADLPAHVAPHPWKKQELMHETYPADTFLRTSAADWTTVNTSSCVDWPSVGIQDLSQPEGGALNKKIS